MTGPAPISERARILSNYGRLAVTFASGLLIIRLLGGIDADMLAAYLLIVAITGFAQIGKIVLQESAVPILGASWAGPPTRAADAVATVRRAAVLAALIGGLGFAAFTMFAGPGLGEIASGPLRIAMACAAIQLVASSLATPALYGLLVSGRVIAFNLALTAERLAELGAILLVVWLVTDPDPNTGLVAFYVVATIIYCAVQALVVLAGRKTSPQHQESSSVGSGHPDLALLRNLVGYNLLIVVGFLLHLRLGTLAATFAYGPAGTLALGMAFLMMAYTRQATMGLVIGLDASISRMRHAAEASRLLRQSTYLQAVFAAFPLVGLWLLAEPLLQIWLGPALLGGDVRVELIAWAVRLLIVGAYARAVSEPWMKLLNGRGAVGDYAPALFFGALLNAGVLGAVLFWQPSLGMAIAMITSAFSAIHLVVHLWVLPRAVARRLGGTAGRLWGIAIAPLALASALAVMCLWLPGSAQWIYVPVAMVLMAAMMHPAVRAGFVDKA
ncbi:hypothetical protein [uncultured Jannaschia sp.]|uniref:hypothetical protein n=1 Tax=uncultured Jannaschia sp. TaxID=293347 RepID=UPI0026070C55|nr:hypothetical protein [uncultured Jannaschia sp.]